MNKLRYIILSVSILLMPLVVSAAGASITLARMFSDHMVLQREKPIKVWGTASAKESFTITLGAESKKVKAQKDGTWEVVFPPMQAGGPYEMKIEGDTVFSLTDILIGDVWLCSGQSNMEWSIRNVLNSAHELATATNENIRSFIVAKTINNREQADYRSGAWQVTTGERAANLSATAYFFARDLYETEKVPIGLICSYWGGTQIESWISKEAIGAHPDFAQKVKRWDEAEGTPQSFQALQSEFNRENAAYNKQVQSRDRGYVEKWYAPQYAPTDWNTMLAPGYWQDNGLLNFAGSVWMRKEFNVPAAMKGKPLILNMERINDYDTTWLNGVQIGNSQWNESRRAYYIPPHLLKEGRNVITVRMECSSFKGGFTSIRESDLYIREMIESEQPICIPLAGVWQFNAGLAQNDYPKKPAAAKATMNNNPGCIFNAMIAPLRDYAVKGMIWSQGEANTYRAYQYRSLFPLLINDWRKQLRQGDVPFVYAQLAGYDGITKNPQSSYLAELREAQALALTLPNTGMVVLIDAGDPHDVHPTNKQIAGRRFANEARRVAYGHRGMPTSPQYEKMEVEGSTIRVWFSGADNGLDYKGATVGGFAIADSTGTFVWAKATMSDNNSVVVWNDTVKHPVAVRYGWANTPVESTGANLYNKEGFPVAPFRTDSFAPVSLKNK